MSSEPAVAWSPLALPRAELPASRSESGPGAATPGGAPTVAWTLPDLLAGAAAPSGTAAEEAYRLGYSDGVRDGETAGCAAMQPAVELLSRLGEALARDRAEIAHGRARDLQALALAVAHKLVVREITADPGIVSDLVTRALELVPLDPPVEVRLNPAELARLAPELERAVPAGAVVQWLSDPTIEGGGFVIETPRRIVDGRTDVALRNLYERLENA